MGVPLFRICFDCSLKLWSMCFRFFCLLSVWVFSHSSLDYTGKHRKRKCCCCCCCCVHTKRVHTQTQTYSNHKTMSYYKYISLKPRLHTNFSHVGSPKYTRHNHNKCLLATESCRSVSACVASARTRACAHAKRETMRIIMYSSWRLHPRDNHLWWCGVVALHALSLCVSFRVLCVWRGVLHLSGFSLSGWLAVASYR